MGEGGELLEEAEEVAVSGVMMGAEDPRDGDSVCADAHLAGHLPHPIKLVKLTSSNLYP